MPQHALRLGSGGRDRSVMNVRRLLLQDPAGFFPPPGAVPPACRPVDIHQWFASHWP
jgi:hypothetical protein